MLLSCIIYVISVLFCYALINVCLLMICGHLLGKGWPLGSRLWCLIVTLLLSHWYPGSGVVLDCIDSWSLPSFLLSDKNQYVIFAGGIRIRYRHIASFNLTTWQRLILRLLGQKFRMNLTTKRLIRLKNLWRQRSTKWTTSLTSEWKRNKRSKVVATNVTNDEIRQNIFNSYVHIY